MSGSRLLLSAAFMMTTLSSCGHATAHPAEGLVPRHLPVTICDFTGVDRTTLAAAEAVAAATYREAGVIIDWAESDCLAGPPALYVNLVPSGHVNVRLAEVALGFAESGGITATVLYDRVDQIARCHHIKREFVLGYVMAHEVGHLLLPPHAHSLTGIMQATLNLDVVAKLPPRFTPEQGVLIAEKLDGARPPMAVATH